MSWCVHMQSTLVFNDLWKDICNRKKAPIKSTDARKLAKWESRDEKRLTLLRSSVTDEMFIHIENEKYAWNTWKNFKKIFDTQSK